ncbi:hypothetical protein BV25DRAFT_1996395 [Artomyces pyxidatus]|uniref:Uncharacterized protein n=1 Tax=Artomyces pyxidatus TaxID=48021 RepID=A0ACB8SE68_9AGAM|nr:hypothetical protein BV25DRAFT_1996395 [Artomyces pyxidatus]
MQSNFTFLTALLFVMLFQTVTAMPAPADTLKVVPAEASPEIDSALGNKGTSPDPDFVLN